MTKKVTGPTIPRWQLGRALERLRESRGLTSKDVEETLGCSPSKVHKLEAGTHSLQKAEVEKLLDLYGVEPDRRDALMELHRLGRQRGWWSQFGTLPHADAMFIGVEEGAEVVRTYEADIVPGLLQTADYARSLERGMTPDASSDEVERRVGLRMDRQRRILHENDNPPVIRAIVAESVFRWQVGGRDVMRAQLKHLADLPKSVRLQVVPFAAGAQAGLGGGFTMLEFDEEVHSPVAYVESHGGNVYMEKPSDIERCTLAYDHLTAVALSPHETRRVLHDALEE